MLSDDHDRDHISDAELALDKDGKFLALRVRNVSNIGAYLAPGGIISPTMHLGGLAGTYTTPAIYVEVSAVFTNTTSIGPYRGSGRPEASYIVERLIDNAAREMGIDRAELRRRNTVPASGDAVQDRPRLHPRLRRVREESRHGAAAWPTMPASSGAAPRPRRAAGCAASASPTSSSRPRRRMGETVMVRFDPGGTVTVIPGSISHGQGHETMYKILLSDRLGIDEADIRVIVSPTPTWRRTAAAPSPRAPRCWAAAPRPSPPTRSSPRRKKIAAHAMEAAEGDHRIRRRALPRRRHRQVGVAEGDGAGRLCAGAPAAGASRSGCTRPPRFSPEIPNFPNGCHVCEVEIDPETGRDARCCAMSWSTMSAPSSTS